MKIKRKRRKGDKRKYGNIKKLEKNFRVGGGEKKGAEATQKKRKLNDKTWERKIRKINKNFKEI